ncbi:nuclear receptor coactivator 2-like, partial [Limulus polyphemus]|uniref:Nuclear receptor coactivator 2-like n=1 Tax=Limulus polyphemus TaxID=6850 RepID=A0ABM1SRA7_LIMPO
MSLVSNDEKKKSSPADNLPEPNLNKCLNDRSGQSQEGICFEELAELISVSLADMSSLTVKPEKCAIIQETVSQIHRIQQAIGESDELQESEVSSSNSSILNAEVLGPLLLEALDGFLVLVNTDGKIEVVSENISYFLKYTKDDLLGKSIYNIIHVGDHARFSSNLLPMSIGNGFGWTSDPGSGTSKSRTFNCRFLIKPPEDPEESMEEKQTRVSQYENMQISTVLLPHFTERSDSPESETSGKF